MILKKYIGLLKVYTVSETLAKGLNWSLLLFLPKLISVENFGIVSLIIAFESIVLPISLNGQNISVLRFFHRFRDSKNEFFKSIFNIFLKWNSILLPLVVIITFFIYKSESYIFLIIALLIPLLSYREIILNYLRVEEDTKRYFSIRVTFQALKFIFIVGLAIFYPESYFIYPLGLTAAVIINIIQIQILLKKDIVFSNIINSRARLTKSLLLFGFPIIFHALSNAVIMFVNRYMIQYFMDEHAVGIFSFAYSISFSLFFILYIGSLVFQPFLYKSKKVTVKSEYYLTLYTNAVFIIISLASVLIWILFPYIVDYYPPDYIKSEKAFRILILSFLVVPFYHQGNFRLTLKNKTYLLPLASGIAAVVNIVLNVILIPEYGIEGAAYSTIASNITIMLITNIAGYNFFKLKNLLTVLILIFGILTVIIKPKLIDSLVYVFIIFAVISIIDVFINFQKLKRIE